MVSTAYLPGCSQLGQPTLFNCRNFAQNCYQSPFCEASRHKITQKFVFAKIEYLKRFRYTQILMRFIYYLDSSALNCNDDFHFDKDTKFASKMICTFNDIIYTSRQVYLIQFVCIGSILMFITE